MAVQRIIKRQVFDISPPAVVVTEHQSEVKICQCGQVNMFFPAGINAPVQYGCRAKALAVRGGPRRSDSFSSFLR